MDSMRGLRTSLPRTSSQRQSAQAQDHQLLQSFREAALSVTALYKQAAAERTVAYQQGYQDAFEDILAYLEKLDKVDDRGQESVISKIRRWASEKTQKSGRDETATRNSHSDEEEDEEAEESDKRDRSSSPTKQDLLPSESSSLQASAVLDPPDVRAASAPPTALNVTAPTIIEARTVTSSTAPSGDFAFRSPIVMPSQYDMDTDSSDVQQPLSRGVINNGLPISMDMLPRARRTNRNSGRSTGRLSNAGLGTGAGSKRRLPLESWFDITGFNGKDGSGGGAGGGGKRGRFT